MNSAPHRCARERALALLLALIGTSPACSDDGPPDEPKPDACTLPFLGDPAADVQIELTVLDLSSVAKPIEEGVTVDIATPPQGGRVIFAGVRATNLDPCAVELSGALRDPQSKNLMVDIRTINLRPTGDGWGTSVDTDISTFANIPVCPNNWSDRDIFDQEYELVVGLSDREKKSSAQRTIKVRPACSEPDAEVECKCICKQGYKLGEECQ